MSSASLTSQLSAIVEMRINNNCPRTLAEKRAMPPPLEPVSPGEWPVGREGPLDLAVMFIDLVSSSEFSSVLGLREYAEYVKSFQELCLSQCAYFFEEVHRGVHQRGRDYEIESVGDELVVFMHTGRAQNDVYQLICLAIALKCGWLAAPHNVERIGNGVGSAELAAGINFGRVWAKRMEGGFEKYGFAINVAKRIESLSRQGDRFRVFVSDPAFKQVNRRMRNLIFGRREVLPMKGVVVPIGVHEVYESFVNISRRIPPELSRRFRDVALEALRSNTLDLWIHSCLQVGSEAEQGCVTDEMYDLCRHVLNIDPQNAVSLYFAAQGARERDDRETAELYLEDLTRHWPHLADGWLEMGRLLKVTDRSAETRRAVLQARRLGVAEEEEELPPADPQA
jgi:class 3 adenylate cyclase